jgi:hypothetical protein
MDARVGKTRARRNRKRAQQALYSQSPAGHDTAENEHGVTLLFGLRLVWPPAQQFEALPLPETPAHRLILQDGELDRLRAVSRGPVAGAADDLAAEAAPAGVRLEHQQADPPLALCRMIAEQLEIADQLRIGRVDTEGKLIFGSSSRRQRRQFLFACIRPRGRAFMRHVVIRAEFVERLEFRRIGERQASEAEALAVIFGTTFIWRSGDA